MTRPDSFLHPEARRLLDKMRDQGAPPYNVLGAAASRRQIDEGPDPGHHAEVNEVSDVEITSTDGPVTVRVYQPTNRLCPATVLYMHGGGWVIGSLRSHDYSCRRLCEAAGCTVVAVEYRLAPEHQFPAGLDDCNAALDWVADNIGDLGGQADAIVVAGDSAGGNLAAALALLARGKGPPIALQVLIYPILEANADTPSMTANAEGYGLTKQMMDWFNDQYCPEEQRRDPLVSPLLAPNLSGLPPALILVAGFDPLHDEGVLYARRLIDAGVPVTLSSYRGQIHGFYAMTRFLSDARRAQAEVGDAIIRATRPEQGWTREGYRKERG